MKVFLDTSALLKLYHSEEGSERLSEILSEGVENIFLSEISRIEFLSALWKKLRTKELPGEMIAEVISCFEEDYPLYHWLYLDSKIVQLAYELLNKYGNSGLRTLDSIQLASAVSIKEKNVFYFTSDKLLQALFKKEGLSLVLYD